jgi:hypothetical protein
MVQTRYSKNIRNEIRLPIYENINIIFTCFFLLLGNALVVTFSTVILCPQLFVKIGTYLLISKKNSKQTECRTDRRSYGQTGKWTDEQTDIQTDGKMEKWTDDQSEGQMDRQTYGQPDRRKDREADKHTDKQISDCCLSIALPPFLSGVNGTFIRGFMPPCSCEDSSCKSFRFTLNGESYSGKCCPVTRVVSGAD